MNDVAQKIDRISVKALDNILGLPFQVHDKGFVRVIDYMGNDDAICQMARVSYGQGTKQVSEDRGLIRYLMRHRHTSPFEGCEMKFHIKMPIFVARQWVRHRTASINEYSGRYSEMKDEFYIPPLEYVKGQSTSNKQGSDGQLAEDVVHNFVYDLDEKCANDYMHYNTAISDGVARETARIGLPLNLYTEWYWKIDLHNLLHFISLRSDPHAQQEIRDYSDVIYKQILPLWVPHTFEAFEDYMIGGARFSAMELEMIKRAFENKMFFNDKTGKMSQRELDEFIKKVGRAN